jgi:type VI secretion system protein ImpA
MVLDVEGLIAPVSEAEPLGPSLRYHDAFERLRERASLGEPPSDTERASGETERRRVEWARFKETALGLAQDGRDLRVWVWLTRASLCADGLPGLADGLRLIAEGSARWWDELPPFDPDETNPLERHLGRFMALAELGVTNFQTNLEVLRKSGRNFTDLSADLDDMMQRTASGPATAEALAQARAAMVAIEQVCKERCGERHDPQLGFELLTEKLDALALRTGAAPAGGPAAGAAAGNGAAAGRPAPGGVAGAIGSRDDVVRAINLILEYYRAYEPSSPVPLLLERARRLVPMTFVDAVKDMAPGGFHELKNIAGLPDE